MLVVASLAVVTVAQAMHDSPESETQVKTLQLENFLERAAQSYVAYGMTTHRDPADLENLWHNPGVADWQGPYMMPDQTIATAYGDTQILYADGFAGQVPNSDGCTPGHARPACAAWLVLTNVPDSMTVALNQQMDGDSATVAQNDMWGDLRVVHQPAKGKKVASNIVLYRLGMMREVNFAGS